MPRFIKNPLNTFAWEVFVNIKKNEPLANTRAILLTKSLVKELSAKNQIMSLCVFLASALPAVSPQRRCVNPV